MRIVVSTHQGNLYNEEIDYFVVHSSKDGEYAVMSGHVPVVSVMDEGYVKIVRDNTELYIIIVSGIIEFHDDVATILVQEAQIGRDIESARKYLLEIRKERLEKNRQEGSDFTKMENDLRDNLRKSKAGHIN